MSWAGVHFGRSSPPMPRHEGGTAIVVLVVLAFGINYSLAQIPPCDSAPCNNGATCATAIDPVTSEETFECMCAPGFMGATCGAADDCSQSTCDFGGTCVDLVGGFRCVCLPARTGPTCERNVVVCLSDPCENDGTCVEPASDNYICSCSPGFTGVNCQTEIDECDSDPCQNGGTCVDALNGFTCTCFPGFPGTFCETPPCNSNPCQNGGICENAIDPLTSESIFTCRCVTPSASLTCSVDTEDNNPEDSQSNSISDSADGVLSMSESADQSQSFSK